MWVIFALLDPDPATQINADPCGSGSQNPVIQFSLLPYHPREVSNSKLFNSEKKLMRIGGHTWQLPFMQILGTATNLTGKEDHAQ